MRFAGLECEFLVLSPVLERIGLPLYWEGGFAGLRTVEFNQGRVSDGGVLLFVDQDDIDDVSSWQGRCVRLCLKNSTFEKPLLAGCPIVTAYYPDECDGDTLALVKNEDNWMYPVSLANGVSRGGEYLGDGGTLIVHDGLYDNCDVSVALELIGSALDAGKGNASVDIRVVSSQADLGEAFAGSLRVISAVVDPVFNELVCRIARRVGSAFSELPGLNCSPVRKFRLGHLSCSDFSDFKSVESSQLRAISNWAMAIKSSESDPSCDAVSYRNLYNEDSVSCLDAMVIDESRFIEKGSWPYTSYSLSVLNSSEDDVLKELPDSALSRLGRLYLCQSSADAELTLFGRLVTLNPRFLSLLIEDACFLLGKWAVFCDSIARIGYRLIASDVRSERIIKGGGAVSEYLMSLLVGDDVRLLDSIDSLMKEYPRSQDIRLVAAMSMMLRSNRGDCGEWSETLISFDSVWGCELICMLAEKYGEWSYLLAALDLEFSTENIDYKGCRLLGVALLRFEHRVLGGGCDESGLQLYREWLFVHLPKAIERWPDRRNLKPSLARSQVALGFLNEAVVTMLSDLQGESDRRNIEGTIVFWALLSGKIEWAKSRASTLEASAGYDSVSHLICAFALCYLGEVEKAREFVSLIESDELIRYLKIKYFVLLCSSMEGMLSRCERSEKWKSRMLMLDDRMDVFSSFIDSMESRASLEFDFVHPILDVVWNDASS